MKQKVMIVDDSMVVRQQVGNTLQQAGFDVIQAIDGQDALEKLESETVSLVVCDVNMPRMNGLEMLETVNRDASNADVHVIMLTSEGQRALIERAKKAGAKGWIVKPFKSDLLVAAVRKLLST